MDLDKIYNNRNLESRRKQLIQRKAAEAAMRCTKRRAMKPRVEILAAFDKCLPLTDRGVGPLAKAILDPGIFRLGKAHHTETEVLPVLLAMADQSSMLDAEHFAKYLPAAGRLLDCRSSWIREPESWRSGSYNVARQFSSLARHLVARYDVPPFFDGVWFDEPSVYRSWYVHVGQGGNLRSAAGLPISLTKLMAHHAMKAPPGIRLMEALRYGQAKGLGVSEPAARALVASRIGSDFGTPDAEAFWLTVLTFLARNPMLDPAQVGPIIDYLHHQKFVPAPAMVVNGTIVQPGPSQPGLTMKGRDPETLIRQVETWHRQLARKPRGHDEVWAPCGIPGYDRVEGDIGSQRRFTVTELLGSAELRGEGAAMKHCVVTYAWSCKVGRSAIYSAKVLDHEGDRRTVTIEVDVKARRIVQVRGRCNELPTALDKRILQGWASVARLTFGQYALGRGV